MILRQLMLIAACLLAGIACAADALPEIHQSDPHDKFAFGDVSLRIESLRCADDGACTIRARGSHQGRAVGLEVVVGAVRKGKRGILYRSIGVESDAFLQALAEIYKRKPQSTKFAAEARGEVIVLEGSLSTLETKPTSIKVFFNPDGPESRYAELYTNVIPAKRILEIHEKDEDYRDNVLKAFAR